MEGDQMNKVSNYDIEEVKEPNGKQQTHISHNPEYKNGYLENT
jgi:hypothetical protein